MTRQAVKLGDMFVVYDTEYCDVELYVYSYLDETSTAATMVCASLTDDDKYALYKILKEILAELIESKACNTCEKRDECRYEEKEECIKSGKSMWKPRWTL
jgi:hypothetical protein